MNQLQLRDDPPCPSCGCNATKFFRSSGSTVYNECEHCGKRFAVQLEKENGKLPVVEYKKTRCPHCGTTDNFVNGTPKGRKRYHFCRTCEQSFASVEKN